MLFNSYEFIFVFLPLTLGLFYLFGRYSRGVALSWLIVASVIFYAWWNPSNAWIIGASIAFNYGLVRLLLVVGRHEDNDARATALLWFGVLCNIGFLGYFKYSNFMLSAFGDLAGTDFVLQAIVLPLGISFFTFQQITVLVDVHGKRIESVRPREYCLYILFFPQLIAGPIVHYREMIPQFMSHECRINTSEFSVGLTLFVFGLFKKVVLADGVAPLVSPIYAAAGGGEGVTLIPAWVAAVGFTLQIYFDFSGYSDMALGIGRCFGVRLPMNFDSPLKASSIIDFWSRWHITLSRFLTAYIYNPLSLRQTRKRIAAGRPVLGARKFEPGAFISMLAFPTILTMFLSGLWHGAGYLFIAWGLLHGVFLTINHAWRMLSRPYFPDRERYRRIMRPVGFLLTFLAVSVAMVLFRATSVSAAVDILRGLVGLNGVVLPAELLQWPVFSWLSPVVTATSSEDPASFLMAIGWIIGLFLIVVGLPNSVRTLHEHRPVLELQPRKESLPILWDSSVLWLVFIATLGAYAVFNISPDSEFLYWQF